MSSTPRLENMSPRLLRIAEVARQKRDEVFTSLAHLMDVEHLHEAYRRCRKGGAVGVDGVAAEEYGHDLSQNLAALHARLRAGEYRAPPVRRVYVPKTQGGERPIGIPTFEDKIVQRAVAMVLEAVYEQDFLDCSFGFRPGRNAHQAVLAVRESVMSMQGAWVIDADIRAFFDSLDHRVLNTLLDRRIRDGSLRRLIGRWLKAGVMEDGEWKVMERGTPQGGVISPLLANVFLHYVLDEWFEHDVRPRLRGRAVLVRYCDDFVMIFEREADARKVQSVLPRRLNRFGLELHPEKTRLVQFTRPPKRPSSPHEATQPPNKPATLDFLGFTYHWRVSQRGNWVVKWKTAKRTLRHFFGTMNRRLRAWRHLPLSVQSAQINRSLRGFFFYVGVDFNVGTVAAVRRWVQRCWRYWLSRRCWKAEIPWVLFRRLLERYPMPSVQQYVHLLPALPSTRAISD